MFLTSRAAALRIFGGMLRAREERGRRAGTPALIREQTKDTIIIFIGDGGAGPGRGGEECRCTVYLFRAEYCGHDVIVDFREICLCVAGTARF